MGEAFAREASKLLRQGRRPLLFANTAPEAEHLLAVLRAKGLRARTWAEVASEKVSHGSTARGTAKDTGATGASKGGAAKGGGGKGGRDQAKAGVIVAVKSVEGQGINMRRT